MNEDIEEDVDVGYELFEEDTESMVASAYGPGAAEEILHYAMLYSADGPVYITRTTTITRRTRVALEDL